MKDTGYAERISKEIEDRLLYSHSFDKDCNCYINLDMKAGYQLTITELFVRAGWTSKHHYSKSHISGYRVYSTKTDDTKYFKSLESLGRAIAGHIV